MKDYVWIKCRTLHSSGPSQWHYKEVAVYFDKSNEKSMEDFLDEQAELWAEEHNTYSEHFRGAEVDFDTPPIEYLKKEIKWAQSSIKKKREKINRIKALIKDSC